MRHLLPLRQLKRHLHAPPSAAYRLTEASPLIRPLHPDPTTTAPDVGSDFILHPTFFDESECRALLRMALWKLDRADTTRRRRRGGPIRMPTPPAQSEGLQDLFDGEYGFEEGHYDSVIQHYRETLLSSLPPSSPPQLGDILRRIYALLPGPLFASAAASQPLADLPPPHTSTHLLHLAPHGAILPHVDNLDASGSVIVGVSLGAERVLRLRRKQVREDKGRGEVDVGWDVRLPSGSVYVQRYDYEHSILPYDDQGSCWDGRWLAPGHRVSIMIRDARAEPARL